MNRHESTRNHRILLAAFWAAVLPHWGHLPAWVVVFILGISLWFFLWSMNRVPAVRRWVRTILTLTACAAAVLSAGRFVGRDIGATLLILMLGLKFLELNKKSDQRFVLQISVFVAVTALLFVRSIPMTLYVLLACGLILGVMVRLEQEKQDLIRAWRTAGMLLLQALPLAAALFLVFPRIQGGLWGVAAPSAGASTGLTDTMAPGSINFLAFSSSVVARAEFSDQTPHARQRYFRALILNHFDGMVWTKGWERENPKTAMEHAVNASSLVTCRITVEAEHTNYLPALDLPLAVSPNAVLHPGFLVRPKRLPGDEFRYRLRSALRYHTRSDVGPEFSLQIPESGLEKSRELAVGWKDRPPEEIIQSGLDFIRRQGLIYTLSPPLLEDDPVDRFLFETKQGYCEHFASAFAMLMRLAGVPSRIVIGFQGGEINPLTDFLVLRASDAHAWCEVWIQDKGWIRVDPTSAVSPDRVELGMQAVFPQADLPLLAQGDAPRFVVDGIRGFRLGLDAVNTFWQQWVLEYSGRRQMELLQKIHAGGNTFLQILIRIGLVLVSGLAVLALILLWKNRPRKESDLVKRSRQKFRKKLAAAEVKIPDWAGPETIQQMVIRNRPDLAHDTQKILRLYTTLSFGRNPDPEDTQRLWELVRSWKPAPRSAYNRPGQDKSRARR